MGARIGVIGAGQVGAAAAYLLSGTAGVSDVVLVDVNTARAAGEAADIGRIGEFHILPGFQNLQRAGLKSRERNTVRVG